MDLEKYLVERDKRLQGMFDLQNRLEPALDYDEREPGDSLELLGTKPPQGSAEAAEKKAAGRPPQMASAGATPADMAQLTRDGDPAQLDTREIENKSITLVSSQGKEVPSEHERLALSSGGHKTRKVRITESPPQIYDQQQVYSPVFGGDEETFGGPHLHDQLRQQEEQPLRAEVWLPEDDDDAFASRNMPEIASHTSQGQRAGLGRQLERVPEASSEIIGVDQPSPLNRLSSQQRTSSQASARHASGYVAADLGLFQDPFVADTRQSHQGSEQRHSSQGQQRQQLFDVEGLRGDPKTTEQPTRRTRSGAPSSPPRSGIQKGSSKLNSNTQSEERSDSTPAELHSVHRKAPVITANEQELMDELKERLIHFMKEEAQLQQLHDPKGLFPHQEPSTTDSSQRDKKSITVQNVDGMRKASAAKLKKAGPQLDELLERQKGFPSPDSSRVVSPGEPQRKQAKTKYILIDKKSTEMLQKTFVDQILQMLIGEGDNGYHYRPRYFTVSDDSQKQPIRQAIQSTLQELGPSFGLQGALIPTRVNHTNRAEDIAAIRLTNELKTEIMHAAMLVLRSQMKSSSQFGDIESLRKVVNLKTGILRKMLDYRRTSRSTHGEMAEGQSSNLEKFFDQKRRSTSDSKDRYGDFIKTAQRVGQVQLFQSLGGKDLHAKKLQLTRKINDLESAQKQKEDRLRNLYLELDKVTRQNIYQEVIGIKVTDRMSAQRKERDEANQLLYCKNNEQILESVQAETLFKVNDLESCIECKEVLQAKNEITDIRLKDALNLNKVYKAMLRKIRSQNQEQSQMCKRLEEKEGNIGKVVKELEQVNQLESQRQMHIQTLQFKARQNISNDQEMMDQISGEKEVLQQQEEEETQQVLYQMLQHTRKIKRFKEKMKELEQLKLQQMQAKDDELHQFQKKQDEIRILNQFWQLSLIKKYKDVVDVINNESENDCDQLRSRALEQVKELKHDLVEARADERFRLIYSSKQAQKARELKRRLIGKRAKQRTGSSSVESTPASDVMFRAETRPHARRMSLGPAAGRPAPESLKGSNMACGAAQAPGRSLQIGEPRTQRAVKRRPTLTLPTKEKPEKLKTDQSESSCGLDLKHSEDSSFSDHLQEQFDAYTIDKENFDSFFAQLFCLVQDLSPQDIIDPILRPHARNKQLREAFEAEDNLKEAKLKHKEQLQKEIDHYQEELKIIGDYIQSLAAHEELRLDNILAETDLGEHANTRAADGESLLDGDEEPTSLQYPISLEGMKYYLERLTFKSDALSTTKIKSVEQLRQVIQSFRDCLGQALFKINTMVKGARGKIDFGPREVKLLKGLSKRYLSTYEKKMLQSADEQQVPPLTKPHLQTSVQSRQSRLSKPRASKREAAARNVDLQRENTIGDQILSDGGDSSDHSQGAHDNSPSQHPTSAKASQDEKQSQMTEMHKINWTTDQHKRLHADLLALIEVIYMAETKIKLSEKLARKMGIIESRLKKKSGSSTIDRVEHNLTIQDFDPVYRRQDFNKVRQGVLGALHVQTAQEKNSLRQQALAGKNKLKNRLADKLMEQSKKKIYDAVEAEYAKAAQKEARKQKATLRRKLEAERLEKELMEKKRNQDSSSESSSANEERNQAALLKEKHDAKIREYIGQFEQKNAFRRETTELYKNKHVVQQVQRTEKQFLQDLKERVQARHHTLSDLTRRASLRKGRSSPRSSLQKSPQPVQEEKAAGANATDSVNAPMTKQKTRTMAKSTKNRPLYALRRTLELPRGGRGQERNASLRMQNHLEQPNLSKLERTNRLYSSLVENAANLKQLKERDFKDPRTQRLMQSLGMTPASEAGPRRGGPLRPLAKTDLGKSFDISKAQQVMNQQFTDLRPAHKFVGKKLASIVARGSPPYDARASNIQKMLEETDFEMRPVTSLCFDLTEKRAPQTASLKQRIKINQDLTKSVKLKPRDPAHAGSPLLQEYLEGLPKILPGILNQDLPRGGRRVGEQPATALDAHFKQYNDRRQTAMEHAKHTDHSSLPPSMSPSQRSRVTINMFNSSFGADVRPGTVAKLGPLTKRAAYTTNQAFNLTYQTLSLQNQRNHQQL